MGCDSGEISFTFYILYILTNGLFRAALASVVRKHHGRKIISSRWEKLIVYRNVTAACVATVLSV